MCVPAPEPIRNNLCRKPYNQTITEVINQSMIRNNLNLLQLDHYAECCPVHFIRFSHTLWIRSKNYHSYEIREEKKKKGKLETIN